MSRGLHRVHACMSLMRTDFTRPHQKLFTMLWSSPSHLHSKSTTSRKWQPSILHHWDFFFIFLPSLFFFLSCIALFLCACHLAVDSNVCCAAQCTCPLLLLFLHPFLFLTSISLHTGELDYVWSCDKDIHSSEFKGTVHSKMIFCHHWPTFPLNLLPYNEKREVEQSLYTIKLNGDWWGSKKILCYYYLLKIILCSQIFWRLCKNIADKSYELFIVFFVLFYSF